jgi:hypothetical protein
LNAALPRHYHVPEYHPRTDEGGTMGAVAVSQCVAGLVYSDAKNANRNVRFG